MQRQIRLVGIGVLIGFIAVFGMLNYVQFFEADAIANNRANTRALLAEYSIKRGDIVTADEVTLARSESTNDRLKYLRQYPVGDLFGHITGYYSHIYGTEGVERSFNDYLLGEAGELSMQEIEDHLFGGEKQGDNVILTVDSRLQQAARDALGGRRGAVVAMDPQTGELLALWSQPSYDPDPLATHDAKEARSAWNSLSPRSATSPLINLATLRRYPPGSTMKVVGAATALENGATPQTTYDDPVALDLPLTDETLQNFTRTACVGGGQIDLFKALEISCDTTFGMIGLELHDEIREMAEAMGFNDTLEFDMRTSPSVYPDISDDNAPFRAFAAIGQGDTDATPIQMALVAATIANGGEVPRPRIVSEIVDRTGGSVRRFGPDTLGEAMSSDTARQVTEMMVAVVASGTGTAAQIPDVEVAGKTGTAQTGREGESPHTWFISFAPADDPKIATAVIVENGGTAGSEATGGAVAAPISKAVMEADRRVRGW
jgi:peptidoglycan glycosyltransferase